MERPRDRPAEHGEERAPDRGSRGPQRLLGLALVVVPILAIYALFSRYIVSGIAMGAIKE